MIWTTSIIHNAIKIPGTTPAKKRRPTETPQTREAYIIIAMLGGIRLDNMEDAEVMAQEKALP